MEVNVIHGFDHCADTVFKHFFDSKKIEEKNRSLGSKNLHIEHCKIEGNRGKIRYSRDIAPSSEIPSSLKKLHKDRSRVTQTEHWIIQSDGSYLCDYDVEIQGVPATLKGKMHLIPEGKNAVNNVSLSIKCKVPLIGKVISGFLAKDSELQMEAEYEIIKQQLIS